MTTAFNNILVPADFSLNTESAVKEAVGLSGKDDTVLHLLHVVKPGRRAVHAFKVWEVEKELEQWRDKISFEYPGLRVKTCVLKGRSIERMIIDAAAMMRPDLIIIGKQSSRRRWSFLHSTMPS